MTILRTSNPQRTIIALSAEIKRLNHTLDQKSTQLIKTQQLNYQLQTRIREPEKSLESENVPTIGREKAYGNCLIQILIAFSSVNKFI